MTSARLEVEADLLAIRDIGTWLRTQSDDEDLCGRLELALQELTSNIVRHGYGSSDGDSEPGGDATRGIVAEWRNDDATSQIVVTDWAPPYQPSPHRQAQPGIARVHGYGLLIIEQLVDRFTHERADDRNIWTLTFAA